MGFCLFCKKWILQPEGKKEKKFCNSTCRSNDWYARNVKGGHEIIEPPQKVYDAPKLVDNFTHDEPLSFQKLREQVTTTAATNDFIEQMNKAEDLEELEAVGRKIKTSGISWKEQQRYHDYGKEIAKKFF